MRTVQWFCLVLLAPSLLPAEAIFEIDPATFPLYWQDDVLPRVTAVVLQHNNDQYHEWARMAPGPTRTRSDPGILPMCCSSGPSNGTS
jgi:hypothetical protein